MKVKLIRDELEPRGPLVRVRKVDSHAEHQALLVAKMYEEVGEIAEARCQDPEEYADLLQAVQDLAKLNGVSWRRVQVEQAIKHQERGGFLKGRVLEV